MLAFLGVRVVSALAIPRAQGPSRETLAKIAGRRDRGMAGATASPVEELSYDTHSEAAESIHTHASVQWDR